MTTRISEDGVCCSVVGIAVVGSLRTSSRIFVVLCGFLLARTNLKRTAQPLGRYGELTFDSGFSGNYDHAFWGSGWSRIGIEATRTSNYGGGGGSHSGYERLLVELVRVAMIKTTVPAWWRSREVAEARWW
jgi:hypothetical protein